MSLDVVAVRLQRIGLHENGVGRSAQLLEGQCYLELGCVNGLVQVHCRNQKGHAIRFTLCMGQVCLLLK